MRLPRRIPKGFQPKAQGCEERATLGVPWWRRYNPERVAAQCFSIDLNYAYRPLLALALVLVLSLLVLPHCLSASEPNSWSLSSPDAQCEIIVTLGAGGSLSYQVLHEGKTVVHKSPLGLR